MNMPAIHFTSGGRVVAFLFLSLALCAGQALGQGSSARNARPSTPSAAAPPSAAELVEQAREQLRQGKPAQAMSLARRAAERDPRDYKPHYYLAYALMELGEYGAATEAQRASLALASSSDARAAVNALGERLVAQRALGEAETALSEGLNAKAGRLYRQAWQAGVLSGAQKLSAAELFLGKLGEPDVGAKILIDLTQQHLGSPESERATQILITLRPQLVGRANQLLLEASATSIEEGSARRLALINQALELDPMNRRGHRMAANEAAVAGDWLQLAPRLKALHKRGWLEQELQQRRLDLRRWQQHAALREYLSDIWGGNQSEKLVNLGALGSVGPDPRIPETVTIPPGRFEMGAVDGEDDEKPVRVVDITKAFELGVTEVTFEQWQFCVNEGGCRGYNPSDSGWGRGKRPVINVSFEDVQAYLAWLKNVTGEGWRLPSESEWEYAARAGSKSRYSWGADVGDNKANCGGCGSQWDNKMTAPVGSFAPNAFGLHDMAGNVWEWVEDCYNSNYSGAPIDGSAWMQGKCAERVRRGGSWNYYPQFVRSANRDRNTTDYRSTYSGFRVARTAP